MDNLQKVVLGEIIANSQDSLLQVFYCSSNLRYLEINYPLKYTEMMILSEFLETNYSLEVLKLTKVKPVNLNFMAALGRNEESKIRELSIEIFKINDQAIDNQPDLPANYFEEFSNQSLEKLTIKGSTYKNYILHDGYFSSLLMMFKNLKSIELLNMSFRNGQVDNFAHSLARPTFESIIIKNCAIERT